MFIFIPIQVFNEFRLQCKKTYGLLPDLFISLPSFSMQAAAKFCNLQLDLISSQETYEVNLKESVQGAFFVQNPLSLFLNKTFMF